MSRNSRRHVAIAVAGVFAVAPLVSACAAGRHPQSAMPTQLTEGVNASVNGVDVRNVFLLGPSPGQQLAAGASAPLYAWFVNKALTPDRLIAVETSGVAQGAPLAGGAVSLPSGQLISTVQPATVQTAPSNTPSTAPTSTPTAAGGHAPKAPKASAGRTPKAGASATPGAPTSPATTVPPVTQTAEPSKIVLMGLTKALVPGETVRLVLHFQRAGALTLNVPVTPRSGYYATYSPAPAPVTPSPTPSTAPPTMPSATPLPAQSASPQGVSAKKSTKPKKPATTPSA